ncbi:paired domain-containing protein [Trichonephila clavipes]|nr:paired domain-containing protein [Trichonephila clavipes]
MWSIAIGRAAAEILTYRKIAVKNLSGRVSLPIGCGKVRIMALRENGNLSGVCECEWCSDGCPVGAKIYEVEKKTTGRRFVDNRQWVIAMSERSRLPNSLKSRTVGWMETGLSQVDAARHLNVPCSVVPRLWNQYQTKASVSRRHVPGRP